MALAVSFYMVSVIALGANGLKSLSIVPAFALGYSSIALLIAGIWEFPSGQTWGAALYVSLSGVRGSCLLLRTCAEPRWSSTVLHDTRSDPFTVVRSRKVRGVLCNSGIQLMHPFTPSGYVDATAEFHEAISHFFFAWFITLHVEYS